MIEFLEWDSNFFGYKVGQIYLQDTQAVSEKYFDKALKEGFKLLYVRIVNANILQVWRPFLEKIGGLWVDERITFVKVLSNEVFQPSLNVKNFEEKSSRPEMYALALRSGSFSRFKCDIGFKNNEFERLYNIWVDRSVTKEIADKVLVYEKEGRIVGLLTLILQEKQCKVGLVAVDDNSEGKGVAYELFYEAFHICWQMGVSTIQLVTQGANQKACRFYQKIGFQPQKTEYTYHVWLF